MKQAYGSAMFLLMILPAFVWGQEPASICRTETKYDRFADTTHVQCDLVESVEGQGRLTVQANASFRGKEPNGETKFWFGLSSYRGNATRRTQPLFKSATTISLSVGSVRLDVPVQDYRKDFFELYRLLTESARVEIEREDLQKLLDAKSLEGKYGGVEFKFSEAALASLKAFISRQVFAASDR